MAPQFLRSGLSGLSNLLAVAVALGVVGCGGDKATNGGTPAASTTNIQTTDGQANPPAQTSAPGPTGNNSTTSAGASSTTGVGASATTGPVTSTGDTAGSGASGGETGGDSEGPSGTSSSGLDTATEDPSGAGTSGAETTSPTNVECTRELLDSLADQYFAALSAGDPSTLPLAANVKFTENAEVVEIGSTDFWKNAGDAKHTQRALDTGACSVAAQAVIPEGATDLPVALRIKVEAGMMTEIETIVVRPGDYTASFAVASDPGAIIAAADAIGWHDEVPEAQRATREELSAWVDKYFRSFPNGVCDVTGDCKRLENGGGNFSCGQSCSGGGNTGFEPRVIIVDEVRGITAGFTIFDFMTTGHLDMHMAKMYGGQVHAVHALLRDTGGKSGWE